MSDLIPLLRALIQDELRSLRLGDVAVVTSVFPHTDEGDEHNYECSVKLREGELELRKVPMCTPHTGMVSAPLVGDLVLITYIAGDPNRPVVVGRLYSDEKRPPVHKEKAWHVESPLEEKTSITLTDEGAVELVAGKTTLTLKKDGDVELKGEGALNVKVSGAATIDCANCTVKGSSSVKVDAPQITLGGGTVEIG